MQQAAQGILIQTASNNLPALLAAARLKSIGHDVTIQILRKETDNYYGANREQRRNITFLAEGKFVKRSNIRLDRVHYYSNDGTRIMEDGKDKEDILPSGTHPTDAELIDDMDYHAHSMLEECKRNGIHVLQPGDEQPSNPSNFFCTLVADPINPLPPTHSGNLSYWVDACIEGDCPFPPNTGAIFGKKGDITTRLVLTPHPKEESGWYRFQGYKGEKENDLEANPEHVIFTRTGGMCKIVPESVVKGTCYTPVQVAPQKKNYNKKSRIMDLANAWHQDFPATGHNKTQNARDFMLFIFLLNLVFNNEQLTAAQKFTWIATTLKKIRFPEIAASQEATLAIRSGQMLQKNSASSASAENQPPTQPPKKQWTPFHRAETVFYNAWVGKTLIKIEEKPGFGCLYQLPGTERFFFLRGDGNVTEMRPDENQAELASTLEEKFWGKNPLPRPAP